MSDRVGQHLGNYRLLRLLGKGGFAEVYLGEHIHLTTQAAVKVLLAHLDAQSDVEGFRHEAQTVARLTHPHIVRVLDFDVEQGVPFLVMEYAPHGSLRARHPRGQPLSLPLILSYVQQVASALQHAHQHRLIHRDVKPDNMLLQDDGSVVLSDFGIVTIAHSTSSRGIEAMAGTAAYMAPEQMQGEPRSASDQYALAVTTYEWIVGQLPFRGTAMEIAMQHAIKPPLSLVEQVPTLPSEVEQVVLTALAKDPKERFATVQAFATALESAVQREQDVSTFIKPGNRQKASAPPESVSLSPGSSVTAPGMFAVPPSQPRSATETQITTPPSISPAMKSRPREQPITPTADRLPTTDSKQANDLQLSKVEPKEEMIRSGDWETVLQRVRLGTISSNWSVYYPSQGKLLGRLAFLVIFGMVALIAGIAKGDLFYLIGGAIWCIVIIGIGLLQWVSGKNDVLILMPAGVLQGNPRKAGCQNSIDYTRAMRVRAKKSQVAVELPGEKQLQTSTMDLGHFANSEALAQTIERAYLQFKTQK
jgi:serine/threonine protein kinase